MENIEEALSAIQFDTLWEHVRTTLDERADETWRHHGDSDAGIAMLQALTYGVSDVGYRHLHPLDDIQQPGGRSVPIADVASLSPETALTTSPVSENDYRRLILDEVGRYADSDCFLYRNVAIARGENEDRLTVSVTPERFPPYAARDVEKNMIKDRIAALLGRHRGLGARTPTVRVCGLADVDVRVTVKLADRRMDVVGVFAKIYDILDNWVSPRASRHVDIASTASLPSVLQGPKPRNGYIDTLPPLDLRKGRREFEKDPKTVLRDIKTIGGVDDVSQLALHGPVRPVAEEDESFMLYAASAGGTGTVDSTFTANGKSFTWHGITVVADPLTPDIDRDEIVRAILALRLPKPDTVEQWKMPTGNYRNVVTRKWAWERLPPSFGLLDKSDAERVVDTTWQFLSAFDTYLDQMCTRLDSLKFHAGIATRKEPWLEGLESKRDALALFGEPDFQPDAVDLDPRVYDRGAVQAHLLRYFGVMPNVATRSTFGLYRAAAVEQSERFVKDVATIGRDRMTAIGPFPALQKEIAFALGLYRSALHEGETQSAAPFYMLDISQMIPRTAPAGQNTDMQFPAGTPTADGILTVHYAAGDARDWEPGAIVSVMAADKSALLPAVVEKVTVTAGRAELTLALSGAGDSWRAAFPSPTVQLRSHIVDSALFDIESISKEGTAGWTGKVALNAVFPWAKQDRPIHVHPPFESNNGANSHVAGVIRDIDARGVATVGFRPGSGAVWNGNGLALSMSVPGVYEERAASAGRVAFVFPLPETREGPTLASWMRKIDRLLRRLVPAHLRFEVYWLKKSRFETFVQRFAAWWAGDEGTRGQSGTLSVAVLETLGLARFVAPLRGIGMLHIRGVKDKGVNEAANAWKRWIFHVATT
ncbi:hypothetical protein [Robbsia sp. KACC 23696]|uniref:hypothetical protein n=1 Tax=Robbsia sp. KACC 23696 TaxID=3149231 RepID=UPI00325BEDED